MESFPFIKKGIPLKQFLILYQIGKRKLYLNYFADTKLIIDWLGPVIFPSVDQELNIPIPWYARAYEITELAKVIGCSEELIYNTYRRL